MEFIFSFDSDAGEVVITYDNQLVLKVIQTGSEATDLIFKNFDKIDDENVALLIKSFARGLFLL